MDEEKAGSVAVHTPVLLEETLSFLAPKRAGEFMIDGTLGEGGHSEAFLSRFADVRICGIDADTDILAIARERLKRFGDRMMFYSGWSHDFFLALQNQDQNNDANQNQNKMLFQWPRPDIILLDLGVSLFHYEKGDRGFSFVKDEVLDMRIDAGREDGSGERAADLLARLSEKDLADLLFFNAEERFSRRIAHAIVEARRFSPVTSSALLADIVKGAVPSAYRYGKIHPATKTFQALRIAVNGELENLPRLLQMAFAVLKSGGRMGVISFHSLEDRIVKNFFRELARLKEPEEIEKIGKIGESEGKRGSAPIIKCRLATKKPLAPTEDEMKRNPPSRSAKLRVVEKV